MRIDSFDAAILHELQKDSSLTNNALSEIVNLSASQCSRRRNSLEEAGLISGYCARLNAAKLGIGFRAVVRVNLLAHGPGRDEEFVAFIKRCGEVRSLFSVSGDADYILDVRVPDLEAFSNFIHAKLLPNPLVTHVRSDIVLRTMKDEPGFDLGLLA